VFFQTVQGSHEKEELVIVHNIDIAGQRKADKADIDYQTEFLNIVKFSKDDRTFRRISGDDKKT
jgi:hypothetical protein